MIQPGASLHTIATVSQGGKSDRCVPRERRFADPCDLAAVNSLDKRAIRVSESAQDGFVITQRFIEEQTVAIWREAEHRRCG